MTDDATSDTLNAAVTDTLNKLFGELTVSWLREAEKNIVRTVLMEARCASIIRVGAVPPEYQQKVAGNLALALVMFGARRVAKALQLEPTLRALCNDIASGKMESMDKFMDETFAATLAQHVKREG